MAIRHVNEQTTAEEAVSAARSSGRPEIAWSHGGYIAQCAYRAESEAAIAVGFPDGRSYVYVGRIDSDRSTVEQAAKEGFKVNGAFDLLNRPEEREVARNKIIEFAARHIEEAQQIQTATRKLTDILKDALQKIQLINVGASITDLADASSAFEKLTEISGQIAKSLAETSGVDLERSARL